MWLLTVNFGSLRGMPPVLPGLWDKKCFFLAFRQSLFEENRWIILVDSPLKMTFIYLYN